METIFIIDYIALGLLVGFMAGLLGIGGGGIMVSIFAILFVMQGFPSEGIMHMALGTSMATIIFTSFSSMIAHYKKDNIEVPMTLRISVGVLAGTFIATFIASYLKGVYLALFFSVFMSYIAYKMFRKAHYYHNDNPHGIVGNIASGTFIGAISALVSIGGGSLSVPYLMHQNFDIKRAIGTSAAIGFPIAISGTLGYLLNGWSHTDWNHYIIGYIYVPAVVLVAISSAFTAPLGVKYATQLPTDILKKVFGLLAVVLSIKMLFSVI
ncbi:MAG: sulfite exporter TauE/SafE family protein [Sulfuricurvum sp.]|uniref:sulfite exporter TauE/SafE family protein n=1 Tax=Sulfuricurvum sp. TaxID=2025608 RepID=UPI00262C1550|nr:sulfite exporter TauE/SafE family protein [Sulfuricurvum sp.]MDD2830420.1 sulfite exporter TauE/SafE family protein [Sulfuricurvum sp.]MDD4950811.1 sulfite exporter TauE/SafE family protein [Sulfuricurvum sp.]